jgi:hypothetical protein
MLITECHSKANSGHPSYLFYFYSALSPTNSFIAVYYRAWCPLIIKTFSGKMMKLNFITGLLCGSIITAGTLITLFIIQDTKQPVNDYSQNSGTTSQDENDGRLSVLPPSDKNNFERSDNILVSSHQQSNNNHRQRNDIEHTQYSANCDEFCVDKLTSKLIDGSDLSSSDWDNIKDISNIIADSISSDPNATRALRDRISYSTEEAEIDGLLNIVSSLPDDSALEIIRDVSSYSNSHKKLALQTLAGLSLHSKGAAREIESLVIGERDPQVLSAALNAIETTDNYEFSQQTWQSLSAQLPYVQDTQLKGSILMSLAKHGKGDSISLKNSVQEGLNSESSDLQMASIEALGYLISRSEKEEAFSSNVKSDVFKSQLNAIAEDSDASSSVRIEALRLLEEVF